MSGARVVTLTANPSLDRTLDLPVPLTEGYIALQSEGWPIEFKDIEIQKLR